jgi:intracellular multiplication protein IcmJ
VNLWPLVLSASVEVSVPASARDDQDGDNTDRCSFCGGVIGLCGIAGVAKPNCALCGLVRHLERPRIDDEARLIWLPGVGQAALIALVREMHRRLRAFGERLDADSAPIVVTDDRVCLYHAQQALLARVEPAAARLGSPRPSDLADTLLRLSSPAYRRRAWLLSGVRLLPLGRFFDGDDDIYPEIVESWRRAEPVTEGTV